MPKCGINRQPLLESSLKLINHSNLLLRFSLLNQTSSSHFCFFTYSAVWNYFVAIGDALLSADGIAGGFCGKGFYFFEFAFSSLLV